MKHNYHFRQLRENCQYVFVFSLNSLHAYDFFKIFFMFAMFFVSDQSPTFVDPRYIVIELQYGLSTQFSARVEYPLISNCPSSLVLIDCFTEDEAISFAITFCGSIGVYYRRRNSCTGIGNGLTPDT